MRALLWMLLAIASLAATSIVAACAAYTFNNVIEARRDVERNERAKEMIAAIEKAADKIPDFNFFKRKEPQPHAPASNSPGRLARFVGR